MTHPYASQAYARAFEGLGEPLACPGLGTWVLTRAIPGTAHYDAAGGYPLSVLRRGLSLSEDLDMLRARGVVSLVLVSDPFFGPPPQALLEQFETVKPFKRHFVHDYAQPFRYRRHHRYEVRRARAACEVRPVPFASHLADWTGFYSELCARHAIQGLQRFSATYFERLAALPGLHALSAWRDGVLIGMHLFVEHEGVAYSHLAAFSAAGYAARAGYALNDYALEHFTACRLIDFGAGAGNDDDPRSGLALFKRGFANREESVLLCGAIIDVEAYGLLCRGRQATDYFPAYRAS